MSYHRLVDFGIRRASLDTTTHRRPLRLGIFGFDRLAKGLLRRLSADQDLVVSALADPAPLATLAHLTRFDSVAGRFGAVVAVTEGGLQVGDREVRVISVKGSDPVDWSAFDVDVVIDGGASEWRDLRAGGAAKPIPSGAELAAKALLDVLVPTFGVERAFVSEVRAYAADDRLADVPATDFRQGRAAAENVSPRASDLAQALETALPALAGRVSASAIHVPVASGAALDLTCWHERPVAGETLIAAMRAAAGEGASGTPGILEIEDQPIVSSDVRGATASAIFDVGAVMVLGDRVSKTLAWFDDEASRPARLIDSLRTHRLGALG